MKIGEVSECYFFVEEHPVQKEFILNELIHDLDCDPHTDNSLVTMNMISNLETSISHISLEKVQLLKEQLYLSDAKLNADNIKQITRKIKLLSILKQISSRNNFRASI